MFTFQEYFTDSVIPIASCKNKTVQYEYDNSVIEFKYNSYGYRTAEFENISSPYLLISGCSLTEGHGLELSQTWVKKLQNAVSIPVVNLAKGAANAEFVSRNLHNWLNNTDTLPAVVIAQWPNPFRQTNWHNGKAMFITSKNADDLYKCKLRHGQEYFYLPWLKSIIDLDSKCKEMQIPILHLCFEQVGSIEFGLDILQKHNINLHIDLKEPNFTWHFDNQAADKQHHSEWCNQQWANRVSRLLQPILDQQLRKYDMTKTITVPTDE